MAEELSPIKRALVERRRLKARIEQLERARTEPIAVIGLGCRFPGGVNGPTQLWHLLTNGVDAIGEMPADRFDVARVYDPDPEAPGKIATRFGGYLTGIDQFDPHAFGISPREAETMDPQHRVLLEVVWEALAHAGCAPDRLTGSLTGVYIGIGTSDYVQLMSRDRASTDIDAYLATGNAHSIASGRISYLLGLRGPSLSIDTACSSSLVAVHLACESLRSRSVDAAIAGGVGILLSEENYISLSKARMMAPDGRCKTFDARADGFVRSEGCGIVVLKRLADAERDGDRVLAVIRGTACNQDGRSNGITAPNGPAQQAVIRAALANAAVSPAEVSYVETHGTGTALGDPIEVSSLAAVLGEGREGSNRLTLGSIKSNLGHLEAAAGVAGLLKAVLALQHRAIPPNVHFTTPNPFISWEAHPYLNVPTTLMPWESGDGGRVAGVSAFGFSGTNVHVVVGEAPAADRQAPAAGHRLHVMAVSGMTDAALRIAARDLATHVETTTDDIADICFSVNTSRAALAHRAIVCAADRPQCAARLRALAASTAIEGVRTSAVAAGTVPRVVWTFADVEQVHSGDIYLTNPTFRAAFDRCQAVDGPTTTFATQYAMTVLWKSWGVTPDAVIADGAGHIAAALVAGLLSFEDALTLARRGTSPIALSTATPQIPFHSTATGRRVATVDASALLSWARTAEAARVNAIAAEVTDAATLVMRAGSEDAQGAWDVMSASVADLFLRGVAIDWRGFDRDLGAKRVDVPASPWMRERYWFTARPAAVTAPNRSSFAVAIAAADRQAGLLPLDVELGPYAALWKDVDSFTTRAITRTIAELGLFASAGESHTVDSALSRTGMLPVYKHLLSLWLQRLSRAGVVEQRGNCYVAVSAPLVVPGGSYGPELDRTPILREYLTRCDRHLAAIVTGRQSPLETLFPDGSFETADFFYRDWGLARYYNGIMGAVAESLARQGDRPLRVLEIGAGTGGSTASLLPLLANRAEEYWFTDISEHFFARAERAFAPYPFVKYRRFDLDADPASQGIPAGHFDLVIAANSVHATKDLRKAVAHARSIIAPGGVLMLYEVTTHFDWFEMSIALIEGWQHHADDLRGETPLLSADRWRDVLGGGGFDRVATYPPDGSPAAVLGHHVIVAAATTPAVSAATAVVATPAAATAPAPTPVAPSATHLNGHGSLNGRGGTNGHGPCGIRDRLAALTSDDERRDVLHEIVQRLVMRVMRLRPGTPPPNVHDRLMSIGMDSLMAVELKKLLTKELDGAVNVPSTLIFDYPTITAIAAFVIKALGFDHGPAAPPVTAAPVRTASEAIAALSDADVEAMLAEQLKGLNA